MPLVGSGCPGQRTTTSGLCRARKTSSSLEFQASSSVCINSALRSSVLIAPPSLWRPPLEGKHVLGYLSSDEGNGDGSTPGRAGLPVGENRGNDTPRRKGVSVGASGKRVGMNLGRLVLRVTVGSIFIEHGTQKLFGWFGGHGPDGTGQFFESLGLRPGRTNAIAAGAAEAGGGLMLALGLATPLAAASLASVMLTALRTAVWRD